MQIKENVKNIVLLTGISILSHPLHFFEYQAEIAYAILE